MAVSLRSDLIHFTTATTMTDPAPAIIPDYSSSSSSAPPLSSSSSTKKRKSKTPFEVYFLATLLGFALISVYVNTTTNVNTTTQQLQQLQQQQRFFSDPRQQKPGDEKGNNNGQERPVLHIHQKIEQAAAMAAAAKSGLRQQQPEAEEVLNTQKQQTTTTTTSSSLAGLDCSAFGGPLTEFSQEMVYWHDIPSDSRHVSPFLRKQQQQEQQQQYLTFEPDAGGFNNIRMAMETVLALAFAMGRTLVLPPENKMYLLGKANNAQRNQFSFAHFFHMEAIHKEHVGLDIITMEEFLQRQALSGYFHSSNVNNANQVVFPPENRTNWNGSPQPIFTWLRTHARNVIWTPEQCMAVFPASPKAHDVEDLLTLHQQMLQQDPKWQDYVGKPVPVNASTMERMKEHAAERREICIYDESLQAAQYIHFPTDHKMNARLLVHSYAFLFFEDWRQDLWMKRFIRDHVRYIDEIQCAAARVVHAIRERAKNNNNSNHTQPNPNGLFDTIHIRRGDFQYSCV
jgi:GDP-fucose protein O-fucosyltransferase